MKRVMVTKTGGPEVITVEEAPVPKPGAGEALVKMEAAGLNYADIMQREGVYLGGPTPPFGAGFEVAGVIEELGEGVNEWRVGDAVMALCSNAFSEYVCVPASNLIKKPNQLDFAQAAAVPCQYLTAYHTLITLADVQPDQRVLIQAAAGGLGTMLVQVAKQRGAVVIGTAGASAKCELIRELGGDYAINYREQDFESEVKSITDGVGCDLVIESVGGEVFDKSLRCVKTRGRLVVLGVASGEPRQVDTVSLLFHNLTVSGFHLMAYTQDEIAMQHACSDLYAWVASGLLRINIGATFSLDQVAEAQQKLASRETTGKVIILP